MEHKGDAFPYLSEYLRPIKLEWAVDHWIPRNIVIITAGDRMTIEKFVENEMEKARRIRQRIW